MKRLLVVEKSTLALIMVSQPIPSRGKFQIDQFKAELLSGLVIYERDGIVRIGFAHYSLLMQQVRGRQATADRRDLSHHAAAEQDKIVVV